LADFSINLKRLRKSANLSQDSLAEQLSVSRQTISSWERGKSYPDLDMLVQICENLHVTPNQLLYPSEKKAGLHPEELISASFFQKIAIAVFIIGFIWGISAGNVIYSPVPNTVSTRFVFSTACVYWGCAFLVGMIFVGISKIITLLSNLNDTTHGDVI